MKHQQLPSPENIKQGPDTVDVTTFIENPDNPRFLKDKRGKDILRSIQKFPRMLKLRPITIKSWVNRLILAGNMRTGALVALGYRWIPREWVQTAEGLTEEEIKRFIVQDNINVGEWNYDVLANTYDTQELTDWGIEAIFGDDIPGVPGEGAEAGQLTRQSHVGDIFTATIGDAAEGNTPIGFTLSAPIPTKGTKPTEEASTIFTAYLKEIDKALVKFAKTCKKGGLTYVITKNGEDITQLYDKF